MNLHQDMDCFRGPGGLFDVEPCELDLDVGRRGRLIQPDTEKHGLISLENFVVVGVQRVYDGQLAYRVVFDSELHRFGCPIVLTQKIQWLTERI